MAQRSTAPPSQPRLGASSIEVMRSSIPAKAAALARQASAVEWRCCHCRRMLGLCRGGRIHLKFAKGHEVLASLPAQSVCRSCGTLNEAPPPQVSTLARTD